MDGRMLQGQSERAYERAVPYDPRERHHKAAAGVAEVHALLPCNTPLLLSACCRHLAFQLMPSAIYTHTPVLWG